MPPVMITVANRWLGADAKEIVTPKRTAMLAFRIPGLWQQAPGT